MADNGPMAEPFRTDDATVTPWAEARAHLEGAPDTYWLATVRPNGRPHVMPLLAVWVDGRLNFCASATTRKAKNLARNSYCVLTVENQPIDLVVEGQAAKVSDEAKLQRVADAYASKYEWPVTVRDGMFYGDGAPTAGPPPYEVYEVTPSRAFGFGTDETLSPTRWRF